MNLADFMRTGGLGSSDPNGFDDQLAFIKKYDPNATLKTRQINQGGGDNGDKFVDQQYVDYDGSKLPKVKEGYTPDYSIGQPYNPGGVPRKGYRTDRAIQDKDYGWLIPNEDVGSIDEKANTAQQSKDTGFIGKLTAGFDQKPWMVLPTALAMGASPAVSNAVGGGTLGNLAAGAVKAIPGAIASGGKSLLDPSQYINAGLGAGMNMLPPEVQQILGAARTVYGAVKDPLGTAVNAGIGAGGSFIGNLIRGKS